MSIRNKLIILFISLLGLLLALQGFLYVQYNEKVSERLGEAAFEISKDTASIFIHNQDFLFEQETYFINDKGQVFKQGASLPENTQIQIRLKDEVNDQTIQLINEFNKEFQIPIPRIEVNNTISELKTRNLWITLIIFIIGIAIVSAITFSITKPLLALNQASRKISEGNFGAQVELDSNKYGQDVADTIEQFNAMSKQIVNYQKQQFDQQELEHMKELSSISRGLAHNLRNPLNTLQLSIEQLEEKHSSLKDDKLSNIAKNQVQRIEDWLQSFTLLMEQGVNKAPVKLMPLVSDLAKQNKIQKIHCAIDRDFEFPCVEAELSMIIQILIQNAKESYQDNSNTDDIEISCEQINNNIEVKIIDAGQGISEDILNSLFKPYTTTKTYGSGMGLYISRRLIRYRYHGDIELFSNPLKGTTAKITLPIKSLK